MRVAFVLPAPVRVPQGGAMVVDRHALGLAALGHDVTILSPKSFGGAVGAARRVATGLWNRKQGIPNVTHRLQGVEVIEPTTLGSATLRMYDAVIATGHQTSWKVSQHAQSRGFYFLQGDERSLGRGVEATWRLPLRRFAVSTWLADVVESNGACVLGVVPNGIDTDLWVCRRSIERRRDRVVALYHRHPVKGPETLIEALQELRKLRPTIEADVFAARTPRHRLPSWVRVRVRPNPAVLAKMYNRAAVCLHTSQVEGWGMVPMEAAACGCAVVATASWGPREYLTPGVSMSEVAVGDGVALAREAARLLRNPGQRVAQARAGMESVSRFRWADSTAALERILIEGIS